MTREKRLTDDLRRIQGAITELQQHDDPNYNCLIDALVQEMKILEVHLEAFKVVH